MDLLKIETELAHANQATLISRNNLESAQELLKVLMGMEDMTKAVRLAERTGGWRAAPGLRCLPEFRPGAAA